MSSIRLLQARFVRVAAFVLPLLFALSAEAVTDRRAVAGAANDVGPSIPEPSSIILFAIGVAVVGYGAHRRRSN
ncbi:MAG: PEP-CTERM sorting domain-containing protein [Deltaproteobacteria bacterium]|nr:PEP-CTERM sorting domain-containing protein [Deltaproteobacteria bacterium]MBW2448004.1 PEP-CTERM sorting domain-containing protein [Deltaproteobacteria bacterium]